MSNKDESKVNRLIECILKGNFYDYSLPPEEMGKLAAARGYPIGQEWFSQQCPLFFLGDLTSVPVSSVESLERLRLPFPKCVFEFALSYRDEERNNRFYDSRGLEGHCSNHHVFCLCRDTSDVEHDSLSFEAIELKTSEGTSPECGQFKKWLVADWGEKAVITFEKNAEGKREFHVEASYATHPIYLQDKEHGARLLEDVEREINNYCIGVVTTLALMSCKNVIRKRICVPEALQKKRIKNGKFPLYDYHVLAIHKEVVDAKLGNARTVIDRASPRLHWRRGHVRHHPSAGNLYISPCVAGKKELGVIDKDYRLIF